MKKRTVTVMKILVLLLGLSGIAVQSYAHEMQHGFVLAADDKFASHLVATGHHSRQAEITGELIIDDQQEVETYQTRKLQSAGSSYFLFQAQSLDLPTLSAGQLLIGHIVESRIGDYEPRNKIVKSATFRVQNVLLNISNPFFIEETQKSSPNHIMGEKKHCCDTGAKPCNWKC